ncbi:MAG TPA: acyl-CoA thioesterase [Thermoplasmata archaeon]|nr:acyl-CoA thioesterase [Thermoplasmata archaeon]
MPASRATVVRLMMPTDANFMGNVFGGAILSEIDRVAYVTAMRHARSNCVTASFDRVDFIAPVRVGDLVEFRSEITFVGRSSIEVWVVARAEEIHGGPKRTVADAYVTMVALGPDGRPASVPPLTLTTEAERRRFKEGQRRMNERRRLRARKTEESPTPGPSTKE